MKSSIRAACFACVMLGISIVAASAFAEETNVVPTRINADKLECDYEERVVYLRGSVVVRDPKGVLRADNATVYFDEGDDKKDGKDGTKVGGFRRVVAVGNVRMSSDDKAVVIISDKAVWSKKDNTIILTGGPPMVRQGSLYIKAKRIIYNLDTQKCEFHPEPEVVFQLDDDDKAKFLE